MSCSSIYSFLKHEHGLEVTNLESDLKYSGTYMLIICLLASKLTAGDKSNLSSTVLEI